MSNEAQADLPYFGAPPARVPRPAVEEPALLGKRVILSRPDGFVYDVRAVGRVMADSNGRDVVEVMMEQDYYRWMLTGERPPSEIYPARLIWVD